MKKSIFVQCYAIIASILLSSCALSGDNSGNQSSSPTTEREPTNEVFLMASLTKNDISLYDVGEDKGVVLHVGDKKFNYNWVSKTMLKDDTKLIVNDFDGDGLKELAVFFYLFDDFAELHVLEISEINKTKKLKDNKFGLDQFTSEIRKKVKINILEKSNKKIIDFTINNVHKYVDAKNSGNMTIGNVRQKDIYAGHHLLIDNNGRILTANFGINIALEKLRYRGLGGSLKTIGSMEVNINYLGEGKFNISNLNAKENKYRTLDGN